MKVIHPLHQDRLESLIEKMLKTNKSFSITTKTNFYYAIKTGEKIVWDKNKPVNSHLIVDCVEAIEVEVTSGCEWVVKAVKNEGVVSIFDDNEIPSMFYRECVCEHCQKNHYRVKTWILQNIHSGEYIELGSSCVELYTGQAIDNILSIESFYNALSKMEISQSDVRNGNMASDLMKFLSAAFAYYEGVNYMYVSKSEASKNRQESTVETFKKTKVFVGEAHKELAKKCLSWFDSVEKNTDFLMNIATVVSSGFVTESQIGIVLYMPVLMRQSQLPAESKWLGDVKSKINIEAILIEVTESLPDKYGVSKNYTFQTVDGRLARWSTGTNLTVDMKVGCKYIIAGTVKFCESRGGYTTVLTRCKISQS